MRIFLFILYVFLGNMKFSLLCQVRCVIIYNLQMYKCILRYHEEYRIYLVTSDIGAVIKHAY